MEEFINNVSVAVVGFSAISFVVALLVLIFDKNNRKKALKGLIVSVILFIIGFGTCLSTFKLGNMH